MPDVQALNLTGRLALLTDGTTVPITNLFDLAGDETDDLAEAVSFVCGTGQHWWSDLISAFSPVTVQ
jgi:hypothetical protein